MEGFTASNGQICFNVTDRADAAMNSEIFKRVVETMAGGVAVADARGLLVFVNDALCELSGYRRDEVIGQSSADFIVPQFLGEFQHQLELREQGATEPYETVVIARDGDEIPVLVSPQALFDAEGHFSGSFALVADVRSRRRTETEREVISEIIRGVVETSNLDELLSLVHESLRRVIYAENCFVALLDDIDDTIYFPYFADQFDAFQDPIPRGKTCTDFVLRTGQPLLLTESRFQDLIYRGEVELVGASSPSWMGVPLTTPTRTIGVLAVQHYRDEGAFSERDLEFFGSVGGHIALAIERKRAEEQLHASRELYTNVVESMSDGVMVLDRNFHFLSWNRAMEELTETPRELVLRDRETPWEVFPHLEELGVVKMMRRAMAGEPQKASNLDHQLKNGVSRVTHETYRPLRGAAGSIEGVVGVVRDVTERRLAEQALEKSAEQLRQAQKMEAIGRLAGGVAHDFNNLLTAINGYSELVLEQLAAEDPIRNHVEEIRLAGQHAAELTQQLLAFSRRQVISPRVVDLNTQVRELETMLRRLIGEDIELITKLDGTQQRIKTDPGQLEQVLINLAVNARDAMPEGGGLTIRTENRELRLDEGNGNGEVGSFVGLIVTDTGVGMVEEVRARIFEPFFSTKETGKGTGMGLSTVYGIVKQNGGRIWVDSEPGEGTTFNVFLPYSSEPLTEQAVSLRSGDSRGSGTILVVEDEDAVRSLTRMILERSGYRVLESANAEEALEVFAKLDRPLDLLLSDVVMPRMSGPVLAARMQERQPDLKVLFISGHADETIVKHGVLMRDTELLVKPFSVQGLLVRVRDVLQDWRPGSPSVTAVSDVRT